MMEHERLIKQLTLENGLQVHFYDGSRRIAGDRQQVRLSVRVPIPVPPDVDELVAAEDRQLLQQFLAENCGELCFAAEKVREFVDDQEAPAVLDQLLQEFTRYAVHYLAHPAFSRRFVLRRFDDWKEQRRLQQLAAAQQT